MLDRHVKDAPRLGVERQEDRIGLLPFLAERFQHDLHQRVISLGRAQEDFVELPRGVEIGRGIELVLEPERVEKPAQHRVVVMPEALVRAEGVGDPRQRFLQVFAQHLPVGDVARNLPHPVHVVGEADEAGRDVGDHFEGAADHCRAQHLAEGTDMGQPAWTIARLEEDMTLFQRRLSRSV
jgi:hypothetical protein